MIVDIIDLTEDGYSNLSAVQLSLVYSAQREKNEVLADADEKKTKELNRLLSQGMARSTLLTDYNQKIDSQTNEKVEAIKEDLLYRLIYSDEEKNGGYSYPENPNYELSLQQRFLVVRDYYMRLTTNPNWRLTLFGRDAFAAEYLQEYYSNLYDLFLSYAT